MCNTPGQRAREGFIEPILRELFVCIGYRNVQTSELREVWTSQNVIDYLPPNGLCVHAIKSGQFDLDLLQVAGTNLVKDRRNDFITTFSSNVVER